MRKLISLLLAVVMVMSLATVAFATTPTDVGNHPVVDVADIPTTITLAAGEKAIYDVTGWSDAANKLAGAGFIVTCDKEGKFLEAPYQDFGHDLNAANSYTYSIEQNNYWFFSDFAFGFENTSSETATFTFELMAPIGHRTRPDTNLFVNSLNNPNVSQDETGEYYYKYTAGTEKAEILTISELFVNYANSLDMDNVNFNVIITRDDNKEASLWSEAGYADEVSMPLAAGQSVIIMVRGAENEPKYGAPYVEFFASVVEAPVGSEVVPVEVAAMGEIEVKAEDGMGAETYYAVNSMLAGSVVTATGVDYIIVGEDKIAAVDGVASAVLNGEGATIKLVVGDADEDGAAYKLVIEPAPTEINAVGDYKATVAAGAEVEYAINSKLAGAILTVEGKDAYIYMGGTKYEAVDGVATAVLDGEGAVIAVKIGNAGTAAGEYKLNIAYAPTVIAAAGDYKVTLAAGAEAEYAVNSKLHGAVVTVKGEGAYLIVDGKKIEGKDGVVTATLEAKAATIKLIVGNAGKATAEWTINVAVAGNPQTGDFGIIAAAVALGMSAICGTAVVAKKKEN